MITRVYPPAPRLAGRAPLPLSPCPRPPRRSLPSSRPFDRSRLRGRHRGRVPAAVAAGRSERGITDTTARRGLHRDLGRLRDRLDRGGHRDLLEQLRSGGDPDPDPARRTRADDRGHPARDRVRPPPRVAGPAAGPGRDEGRHCGRPAAGGPQHRPVLPGDRSGGGDGAGRPVHDPVRRSARPGRLERRLPRGVGLQQRRLLPVRRQPDALRVGPVGQRGGRDGGDRRRSGLPGDLRAGPGLAPPADLERGDPDHRGDQRWSARARHAGPAGHRVRQPSHARRLSAAPTSCRPRSSPAPWLGQPGSTPSTSPPSAPRACSPWTC